MKNVILYTVTTFDYNGDGKLDEQDPNYLFTSDMSGNNFKQITPNNRNISNFQPINKSDILLIQSQIDSNSDKKFGSKDEFIPMIFKLSKDDKAKQTFSTEFRKEVNAVFSKTYKN